MLTDCEREEILREIAHYPKKQGGAIEALKIAQRYRGWISDETLGDLAGFLGMTTEELDSIATFYNLIYRRPVGRNVILVCDTITCWIMGYEAILAYIHAKLGISPGETTADGLFTLLPVPCLGACDRAPALMINGDLHGDLTPERLDDILAHYREKING